MFTLLLLVSLGTYVEGDVPLFEYKLFHDTETKPPVYVEEIQRIDIFVDNWKFLTRLDMNYYDNMLQQLRVMVNKTIQLCKKQDESYIDTTYKLKHGCEPFVVELNDTMNEMDEFKWTDIITSTVNIRSEKFFTRNDFHRYITMFDEMKESKMQTRKFVNERTTIIESNRQLFQNNVERLKTENDHLDILINDISKISNTNFANNELKGARIKNLLQDILSYTSLLMMDYKEKQKLFIEVIKSETHSLLPPQLLLQEIKQLLKIFDHRQLPFDIYHESIATFYNIANVQSKLVNNELIVVFLLPIVEPEHFSLYHLTPYPRQMEGGIFQLLLPEFGHVIINRQTKNYIMMSRQDLKKCHHNNKKNNTLLCPISELIISTEESGSCAIDLLTKSELPSNCNYRIMAGLSTEIWFKLSERNSWLFVFPKAEEVSIDCNGKIDTRYVNGAGTLTIQPECSVKTEFIKIQATEEAIDEMHREVELTSEMKLNWKDIINDMTKLVLENIKSKFFPRVIDEEDVHILEGISTAVSVIKTLTSTTRSEHQLEQINKEHQLLRVDIQFGMYVMIACLLFALTFISIKALKKCCKHSHVQRPARDIDTMTNDQYSDTNSYVQMEKIV